MNLDTWTTRLTITGDLIKVLVNKVFGLRKDYKDLSDVVFKDEDALAAFASLLIDKRKHEQGNPE